ncbi:MAG: glycosyltransferase family 39 protein [Thermoanaerobaculia bacterium]
MIRSLLFIVQHAAMLAGLLLTAAAAGTAVAGPRPPLALRSALGLAVAGQVFAILAAFGALRPWAIGAFIVVAVVVGAVRFERTAIRWQAAVAAAAVTLPLFTLALFPPIAFDETLYHLPFVRAISSSGAIRFLPDLRFPLFPQLQELLCVPELLLLGDTATHLVAVAEALVLAGILTEWSTSAAAAALFLGTPIAINLATITYTDMALALFIAAGFYCLDRATAAENQTWWFAAAGIFFGTACSVKYLGWYFAVAALAFLLLWGRRAIPIFLASFGACVVPMYARIVARTGNPVFPFLPNLFGKTPWAMSMSVNASPAVRALRLFWDITFAREHLVNIQPPYSPLFAVSLLITIVAARRNRRAAFLVALCAGYIAIFIAVLPQDSRYLLPLLPLVSVAATIAVAQSKRVALALTVLSMVTFVAYVGYRLERQGAPPLNTADRAQYLERRIPEYRALQQRGPGRIYVCGAEQLRYFGGDDVLGDVSGLYSEDAILGGSRSAADLSSTLGKLGANYLLVSRRACPQEWQHIPAPPQFEQIYADGGAVLWRSLR